MLKIIALAVGGVVAVAVAAVGYVAFELSRPVVVGTAEAAGYRLCRLAKTLSVLQRQSNDEWTRVDCRCLSSGLVQANGEARAAALLEATRLRAVAGLTMGRDKAVDTGESLTIPMLVKAGGHCWSK